MGPFFGQILMNNTFRETLPKQMRREERDGGDESKLRQGAERVERDGFLRDA